MAIPREQFYCLGQTKKRTQPSGTVTNQSFAGHDSVMFYLYVNKVHWLQCHRERTPAGALLRASVQLLQKNMFQLLKCWRAVWRDTGASGRSSLHLVLGHLKTPRTPTESRKRPSGVEQPSVPSPSLPPPSAPLLLSSFSRGASSHVAVSLFRYQGRIVRIDCDRAQRLAARPPHPVSSVTRT